MSGGHLGDTKSSSPCIYNGNPWGLELNANFGLDMIDSFKQFRANSSLMWQQNLDGLSYYIQANYTYLTNTSNWETLRHRALGVVRADFFLARLSKTLSLSLPVIATVAYDNILGIEPRVTAGGGLWLNYKHPSGKFYNGLSLFPIERYERGGGIPSKWALTLSLRDFFKIKLSDALSVIGDFYFVQSTVDANDFSASFDPTINVKLDETFSLNIAGSLEYYNSPRNPYMKKWVFSSTCGIKVNFEPAKAKAVPAAKVESNTVTK